MFVLHTIEQLMQWVASQKESGKSVGLVPTMGYLHEGHLDLIRASTAETDSTLVTIFVNPTQFGENEDLEAYPRDMESDLQKCESLGAAAVFAPSNAEMYLPEHTTYIIEESASQGLCGISRPSHFRGVLTVCAKLFNLARPDIAFFGQKDAQQVSLIEKMVRELNFSLKIVRVPTHREADGLAMSSRNAYLNPEERAVAPALFQALQLGLSEIKNGNLDPVKVQQVMRAHLSHYAMITVDYLEVVDRLTLKTPEKAKTGQTLLAGAIYLGKTRLIDNIEG